MILELKEIKEKIKLLSQSDFINFIQESPLSDNEKEFMLDVRKGFSNEFLSQKYKKNIPNISHWKRNIYEKLYRWEKNTIEIPNGNKTKKIDINEIISQKINEQFKLKNEELNRKEELLNKLLETEEKKRIQKKLRKIDNQFNSRGTKKAEPIILINDDSKQDKNQEITITKKELKKKYLPMYIRGEISSKEICNILEITPGWLSTMKKDYLEKGDEYFHAHGNIHRVPSNITPDKIKTQICSLYKEKYEFKSLKDFVIDLEDLYKIKISISTVKKILKEQGIYVSNTERFIGTSNEQIGTDFLAIMNLIDETILKKELSILEQFGLIELCGLAFSKTYLTLNSILKKIENISYRTSYSCISHYIDNKIIDIQDEWTYWNKNHEHFSYIYNEYYRLKVISDIRNKYYSMFKKIENYVKEVKEKLA